MRHAVHANRLIVGENQTILNNATVIVNGPLIEDVRTDDTGPNSLPPNVSLVDYGEATILPGLIDAHCHLTLSGYEHRTYEEQIGESDEMMALVAVRNMQAHLRSGVTTLRDNGGRNRITFEVRRAVERGYFVAPRLLLSGRPLTHTRGHFDWCNGEADGMDGIQRAIRTLVADGADHIKIMASGGATVGTYPQYASYRTDELRWAVEMSHDLGRLTTAHCRAKDSMARALEAGLDCIEHAEFIVPRAGSSLGEGLPGSIPNSAVEFDNQLAHSIGESSMFVSVTLQQGGYDTLRRLRNDDASIQPHEAHQRAGLEAWYETKLETVRKMLDEGLANQTAISSDAGVFDVAFGKPAYGLELGVAAGMTPVKAIEAMTGIAARVCGVSDSTGTLTPGKQADLLVVRGDATSSVSLVADVEAVFLGGQLVPGV